MDLYFCLSFSVRHHRSHSAFFGVSLEVLMHELQNVIRETSQCSWPVHSLFSDSSESVISVLNNQLSINYFRGLHRTGSAAIVIVLVFIVDMSIVIRLYVLLNTNSSLCRTSSFLAIRTASSA